MFSILCKNKNPKMGTNRLSLPLDADNSTPVKIRAINQITTTRFLKLEDVPTERNNHKINAVDKAKTNDPIIVFESGLQFI